jgi:hypothetical protein
MLQILAVSAALAAAGVDLPTLLERPLREVKAKTTLTVLLPQKLPDRFDAYFPGGSARTNRWELEIGAAKDCNGANVCFVARFAGRRRGKPAGRIELDLARGRIGRFTPLSCGASCSSPAIEWRERGAVYTIQAKVPGRRALVRMANSAIRHGRR